MMNLNAEYCKNESVFVTRFNDNVDNGIRFRTDSNPGSVKYGWKLKLGSELRTDQKLVKVRMFDPDTETKVGYYWVPECEADYHTLCVEFRPEKSFGNFVVPYASIDYVLDSIYLYSNDNKNGYINMTTAISLIIRYFSEMKIRIPSGMFAPSEEQQKRLRNMLLMKAAKGGILDRAAAIDCLYEVCNDILVDYLYQPQASTNTCGIF